MTVFFAVEDELSRAVIKRLISDYISKETPTCELGKKHGGFGHIKKNLKKYADLSAHGRVVVITDLDDNECPPSLRSKWLSDSGIQDPLPDNMAFCIAVREIESWLLSDRMNFSEFLGINVPAIDRDVEENVENPKEYIVRLAQKSRNRSVKEDIIPPRTSPAIVGLSYNFRLSSFVTSTWNPSEASSRSTSLRRAIEKIKNLRAPVAF